MARFNLDKGERFNLTKDNESLNFLRVDLSWEGEGDLDAEAFMLTEDGIIDDNADFVFYNSERRTLLFDGTGSELDYMKNVKEAPYDRSQFGSKKNWKNQTAPLSTDDALVGSFDDLGSDDEDGEESGETMRLDLNRVRPAITEIDFTVTIHNAPGARPITFRDVKNPRIVITNIESGEEICSYNLKEKFSSETAVIAGAVKLNDDGDWEFEAVGKGFDGGLQTLVDLFT